MSQPILIDSASVDTVGIYLLEKEEGVHKKKKLAQPNSKVKAILTNDFAASVLFCKKSYTRKGTNSHKLKFKYLLVAD